MIKKQFRNRAFACLNSEMVGGFPPYTIEGLPVPEHSICEVMDDDTLRVVAVYKLHQEQWYRYDLVSVWPPYPPQPEPLQKTISLGLVVPGMPVIPTGSGGQLWTNYPETPFSSATYPAQWICKDKNGDTFLAGRGALYSNAPAEQDVGTLPAINYKLTGGAWVLYNTNNRNIGEGLNVGGSYVHLECNSPVYSDSSQTTVRHAKTTTPEQDAGSAGVLVNVISQTQVTISKLIVAPNLPSITESL